MSSIAHYNLLERIGEGGLGEVFRARDTMAGRTVALKLPGGAIVGDPGRLERFLEDARAAAQLSHPNLAALWEVGEDNGRWYLAYEFVVGTSLRQQMGGRSMNVRHALEIAVQVADALAEVHAHGLVHGDVRPDTIAISGKGSAKLLEAGMSRWTRGGALRASAASAPASLDRAALPVLAYLSPEQALGGRVDARSDVFSLATVVYEMLSGRHPFAASTPAEVVLNVTSRTPPSVRITNSGVPRAADAAVSRALAKDLGRRHPGAASFAADLRRALASLDTDAAAAASSGVLPIDEDEKPRAWIGYVVAVAVLGALALWWMLR